VKIESKYEEMSSLYEVTKKLQKRIHMSFESKKADFEKNLQENATNM